MPAHQAGGAFGRKLNYFFFDAFFAVFFVAFLADFFAAFFFAAIPNHLLPYWNLIGRTVFRAADQLGNVGQHPFQIERFLEVPVHL